MVNRLIKAIKSGRFAWEKYYGGGRWYGVRIQVMPLFCSYGQIGFTIYSPYGESFNGTIKHDWELNQTSYNS